MPDATDGDRAARVAEATAHHRATTGAEATVVIAVPGRVNLIGEHVDDHRGPVLPMAIDRAIFVCAHALAECTLTLHSAVLGESARGSIDLPEGLPAWAAVVPHAARRLGECGIDVPGLALTVTATLPVGAGLSSSAAWIVAVLAACTEAGGAALPPAQLVTLVPEIEAAALGVPCGPMDPIAVVEGRAGHALAIDTGSGSVDLVELPAGLSIAVLDTGTRRTLGDGRYAERHAETAAAARTLGLQDLRDATLDDLAPLATALRDRATHVVEECARTRAAVDALRAADLPRFGALLDASHASLRDLYRVSSDALDTAVASARRHPETLGARLTGAGFAGCAIAAGRPEDSTRWARELDAKLRNELGGSAGAFLVRASDGATRHRPLPVRTLRRNAPSD